VEHRYDVSREFPGTPDGTRPVQILVWYPASPSAAQSPMKWKEYFATAATEIDFTEPDDIRRWSHLTEVRAAALESGAQPERFDHLLHSDTHAYRDAPSQGTDHPLVVFVPGHGAPAFQNTVACEYLASHGFVVAAFSSVGAAGREMTGDDEGVTAQVRDIGFVIRVAGEVAPVDPERVAVVGYSWGGLTAVFAAMRGMEVDAVVSIEPTLMVQKGHALARALEGYAPGALKIPVAVMIADSPKFKARDLGFFDELPHGRGLLLRFPGLTHGDFASTIIRFFIDTRNDDEEGDAARVDMAYAVQCRYLLAFLDAHLRGGTDGRAFLGREPAGNGIPSGIVAVTRN